MSRLETLNDWRSKVTAQLVLRRLTVKNASSFCTPDIRVLGLH